MEEFLERHHLGVGPPRQLAGHHVGPVAIAALPRGVQPIEAAVLRIEPAPERPQRVRAEADQPIGLDVPAQLVPDVPADQVGRAGVATADRFQERAHPPQHLRVVGAAARRQALMRLAAVGGNDGPAHVVDHVCVRDLAMDPERVQLGDGAEHDPQAALAGFFDQLVIIAEVEAPRLRLHPAPEHPELHGVQPGVLHPVQVFFPVAPFGERRPIVLRGKNHGVTSQPGILPHHKGTQSQRTPRKPISPCFLVSWCLCGVVFISLRTKMPGASCACAGRSPTRPSWQADR